MHLLKSPLVPLIALLVAACGAHRHASAATATAGTDAILLTLAELEWVENAERPGTYQAAAEGDPDTGPAHFYLKYTRGFTGGLHSHTSDHGGWILAGTVILVIDGKETKLPPGAFYFVKGGKPHTAQCDPGAECIMTVDPPACSAEVRRGRRQWLVPRARLELALPCGKRILSP